MALIKLTPAQYVIQTFKGVRRAARAIDWDPSNLCKWKAPKSRGGGDGGIPQSAQRAILEKAKELNLDITAEDLIFGREVEVDEAAS